MIHPSIEKRRGSIQDYAPLQWKTELTASLIVTTRCNRKCPHCCAADLVKSGPRDMSLVQLIHDVRKMGQVFLILLTGGEPTLYTDFVGMLTTVRKARGNSPLILYTNGAKLLEYGDDIVRYCDGVRMSVYEDDSNAGASTPSSLVGEFMTRYPTYARFIPSKAIHQKISGGYNPCHRLFNTISVQEGRVYPCCVAHGIADSGYTDLSMGWERRLLDIAAPCERCAFGLV